jgi:2-keto-4-pentenoate hydratase/2-oxohepta-3-ene-1,7-dioic acid hydratase in catechol pathway
MPTVPVVFLKPSTALIETGQAIILPSQSASVHHEVELVAVVGEGGKNIPVESALSHVAAYAVGLDMTARDLQSAAKAKGLPWSVAKGFDTFAPLGPLTPSAAIADPQRLDISLHVNGELRQKGNTAMMLYSIAQLIAYCSSIFTFEPGDLLYTGTPAGVGPVVSGDRLEAAITGLEPLNVMVLQGT